MTTPYPEKLVGEPEERCYLLVKRGLYYRPDNQGYTGIKDHAGRYFESDACPEGGVAAVHESEAPDFSPACFHDLALDHLRTKLTAAQERIAALEATQERAREALAFTDDHRTDDASLNLQGAADDLSGRYKPNDGGVCVRTINRVIKQLEAARAALQTDGGANG